MFKKLALTIAVTLLSLLVAEMWVRLLVPVPWFEPFPRHQPAGMIVPHPTRSYTLTPDFVGKITTNEYQIDVATNSIGLRDDPIAPNERVDILAVGDSFTVGFGVQAQEAWPAQLESYLNTALVLPDRIRVVNAGVSGYSLAQIHLMAQQYLSLNPKIVAVGLYPSRYWRLDTPYVYFEGRALKNRAIPYLKATEHGYIHSNLNEKYRPIHFWLMENFHLGAHAIRLAQRIRDRPSRTPATRPMAPKVLSTKDRLARLLSELGKIDRMCQEHGAGLVVLLVNEQQKNGKFSEREKQYNTVVKDFCKESHIAVFDPIPYFEGVSDEGPVFRIGRDHHWSKRAHALVGQAFGAFLLRTPWVVELLREPTR